MSNITRYQSFQGSGFQLAQISANLSQRNYSRYSHLVHNSSNVTLIGSRLIQNSDGSLEIVLKTPAEMFGEYVIRPALGRTAQFAKNIDRAISNFFNFMPIAKADQILKEEKEVTCRDPEVILEEKLNNPSKELSNVESIALLSHCIYKGDAQAKKALGKRAVVFLGNTGSAKSTTINYLFGLTMKKVRPKDIGLTGFGNIVIVDPNQKESEVTPIGHQITHSKTFMPQVEVDEKNSITYVDCPGFLDDRGAEINIANAVNIKKVIKNCDTVKFVILINYHSLVADKANGIRQLIQICHHLFSSEKSFLKHKDSIHIGITRAPEDFEIEDFKEVITKEISSLKPFSSQFFSYDPLGKYGKQFWTRKEFIKYLKKLKPINKKESSELFKTVLRPEDENVLKNICESIDESIELYVKNKQIKKALDQLKLLDALKEIDHTTVYKLIKASNLRFLAAIRDFERDFELYCAQNSFESAKKILDFLLESEKFMTLEMKNALSLGELEKILKTAKQKKVEHDKEINDLKNRRPQIIKVGGGGGSCIIL